MTETPDKSKPPKRRKLQAAIGAVLLLLFVAIALYLRSAQFHEWVRGRVVADLEQITGGRVEIRTFDWTLWNLDFAANDVTIHGREGPGETPYAHVDRLEFRAKVISLLSSAFGLRYLSIEHPVIHIIVYADGTTNQPAPKNAPVLSRPSVETLFKVRINQAEVRRGVLLLNDRVIPLDFTAEHVNAGMTFVRAARRYDGKLEFDNTVVQIGDLRALPLAGSLSVGLGEDMAELKSLQLQSVRSHINATGKVTNFTDPRVDLSYESVIDLVQFGATTHLSELRSGMLQLHGQGSWTYKTLTSTGQLQVRDLEWRQGAVVLRNINAGAQYSLDKDHLSIAKLFGVVLGGTARGDIDIWNWTSWGGFARQHNPAVGEQRGSARLIIDHVPVAQLAAVISSSDLPVAKLKPVGSASGTMDAKWIGLPSRSEVTIAFDLAPPLHPESDQLPLTGRVRGLYHSSSGTLDVAELNVATRGSRLSASGKLGPTSENLTLAFNTNDLGELQPALAALHGPSNIPVQIAGRGSFTGTITGKVKSSTVAGHVEIQDFSSVLPAALAKRAAQANPLLVSGTPSPSPNPQPVQVHWDLLKADITYSATELTVRNGLLRHGPSQAQFDVTAALFNGMLLDDSPVTAQIKIQHAELADLQALALSNYPVSGKLDLTVNINGSRLDPRGSGDLKLTDAQIYGEPFSVISAELLFGNREAQANSIVIRHGTGQVSGNAIYNLQTRGYVFNLLGTNFDLSKFKVIQRPKVSVAGALAFTAHGSGTFEKPSVNATLHVRSLTFNGERAGDVDADAVTVGRDLRLTAHSTYQNKAFNLDGTVEMRGDWPANIALRFAHLDIDPLIHAYINGRITGHSSIAGTIDFQGPLRRREQMHVAGNISEFAANIENIQIHNDGPLQFQVERQLLTLQHFRLVGDGTDVIVSGTAEMSGAGKLDIKSYGRANLTLLQSVNPDYTSDGIVTFRVDVGGVMSRPDLQGELTIANGGIAYADLPNGLSEINGTMVFNQDRLSVQTLTARTGGGLLKIGGYIGYGQGIDFNLTANGRDIRLRYPPGVSAMANVRLKLLGSLKNSTLSGDIVVTRFGVNPDFDFATYLARSKLQAPNPDQTSAMSNMHFDVHVTSSAQLQVQTSMAKLTGDVDLRLRGTPAHPVVLGRVDIAEGDIFFNATKYHLERGDITFTNPVAIEPVLDLEATARVRDYDLTISLHGPLDRPSINYRSEPPLPTGDIIALLALGRTREERLATAQPSFTDAASAAILGQAVNATVSNRVQKLFGVSRIKIDPQAGGLEGNPAARLTVEQQVNNNITLTYITNLAQSAQQVVQVEYNVNRNVSIIAIRDYNGVVGFDVRVRSRRK